MFQHIYSFLHVVGELRILPRNYDINVELWNYAQTLLCDTGGRILYKYYYMIG